MNDFKPYINLAELIEELEKLPQDKFVSHGFHNPHSYRGYYQELAFEPKKDAKISGMLACAKDALGSTYTGWKGGEFTMKEWTECYITEEGSGGGDRIGQTIINLWKNELGV